jgi:hypothetical protein
MKAKENTMSKYQEALERVMHNCIQGLVPNSLFYLQEAITKAEKYDEMMKKFEKLIAYLDKQIETYDNGLNAVASNALWTVKQVVQVNFIEEEKK